MAEWISHDSGNKYSYNYGGIKAEVRRAPNHCWEWVVSENGSLWSSGVAESMQQAQLEADKVMKEAIEQDRTNKVATTAFFALFGS